MHREKLPTTVNCYNCGHTMALQKYICEYPNDDVPEERIRRIAYPRLAGYTVQCICGHYMRYFNPADDRSL